MIYFGYGRNSSSWLKPKRFPSSKNMNIIRNKKAFLKYHKSRWGNRSPEKEDYPTSYPCLGDLKTIGGGLLGGLDRIVFIYPPKDVDFESFAAGVEAGINFERKY